MRSNKWDRGHEDGKEARDLLRPPPWFDESTASENGTRRISRRDANRSSNPAPPPTIPRRDANMQVYNPITGESTLRPSPNRDANTQVYTSMGGGGPTNSTQNRTEPNRTEQPTLRPSPKPPSLREATNAVKDPDPIVLHTPSIVKPNLSPAPIVYGAGGTLEGHTKRTLSPPQAELNPNLPPSLVPNRSPPPPMAQLASAQPSKITHLAPPDTPVVPSPHGITPVGPCRDHDMSEEPDELPSSSTLVVTTSQHKPHAVTSPSTFGPAVHLNTKELLGRGSFGAVFKAMNRETNEILAVKEIMLVANDPKQIQQVSNEILLMKKLKHKNIVGYHGAHRDGPRLLIHMEYVDGGSIKKVMEDFGAFTERQTQLYTQQMLEGLAYLHDMKVVHRDLKGENLLVNKNGVLKLSDFGTSRELKSIGAQTMVGTSYFMAPEVIKGTGYDLAADIWSVGCCVVEMLTGKPPFSHFESPYAAMIYITDQANPTDIIPSGVSDLCAKFLKRCLVKAPEERATAHQLLAHPWLGNCLPQLRDGGSPTWLHGDAQGKAKVISNPLGPDPSSLPILSMHMRRAK